MGQYREFFEEAISQNVGKVVYDARGALATRVLVFDEDAVLAVEVYTLDIEGMNHVSPEEWDAYRLMSAIYDLHDVDFDSIVSVSAKIPNILDEFSDMFNTWYAD